MDLPAVERVQKDKVRSMLTCANRDSREDEGAFTDRSLMQLGKGQELVLHATITKMGTERTEITGWRSVSKGARTETSDKEPKSKM